MTELKVLLGTLVLSLFAGCATTERAPADVAQRVKRVAVVSTAAGVFGRQYIGHTAFGNERHVKPIPEWRLDRIYEEQITKVLRNTYGMTVVDADIDPKTFAKVDRTWPDRWPDWGAIDDVARKTCTDHKLDGLFVLAKVGDWGPSVYAVGHPQGKGANLALWAQLALIDCATGKPMAARLVQNGVKDPGVLANSLYPPTMTLPEGWPWYGEWQPEVYDQARIELIRLPQQAWIDTLTYMLKSPAK